MSDLKFTLSNVTSFLLDNLKIISWPEYQFYNVIESLVTKYIKYVAIVKIKLRASSLTIPPTTRENLRFTHEFHSDK